MYGSRTQEEEEEEKRDDREGLKGKRFVSRQGSIMLAARDQFP
jgi:hypothetical protein